MAVKINLQQSKKINALIRRFCCNCANGNCLLLDDGEEHNCVQLVSKHGVYCNYLLSSVLPADKELFAEVMRIRNEKHCRICGKAFVPKSKIQRYCTECAKVQKHKKQPSDNAKSECLCHAFKEWNATCYKAINEPSTGK